MLSKSTILPLFVIAAISTVLYVSFSNNDASDSPFFQCPTDDSYLPSCAENVIPPWPICKSKSFDEWVEKARDCASRCCGGDLSECKCPKKDTDKFLDRIDEWCDGVYSCDDAVSVVADGFKYEKLPLSNEEDITSEY